MQVSIKVNGEEYTREIEPRLLLVHFLRDELRLTGTHWGCDTSNCGVCVVQVDGIPVKSCTMLAAMAGGHEVRTVEGLAAGWRARSHPAGVHDRTRSAMRVLYSRNDVDHAMAAGRESAADRRRDPRGDLRQPVPLHGIREHRARSPLGRRSPDGFAETEEVGAS